MRQRERAQSVQSSHYIARVLTKDWRTEDGKLRFYDFTTGQCGSDPASALFVASEPWGDDVEKWLNHNIETPLGLFVKNRWSLEECREKTILASCRHIDVARGQNSRGRGALTQTRSLSG